MESCMELTPYKGSMHCSICPYLLLQWKEIEIICLKDLVQISYQKATNV